MKVIILCGGKGTRLSEETKIIPKPLVRIGNKPILVHIINYYKKFGFNNFIIPVGYKGYLIKEYFSKSNFDKNIKIVDTGLNAMTGRRLLKLKNFFKVNENFMLTYGDGLSDVDISKTLKFHLKHKKIATLTAVRPPVRFGELRLKKTKVTKFMEKTQTKTGWINGGYFILNQKVFSYINKKNEMFEKEPITRLVKNSQVKAFKHNGFWQCMDTLRDKEYLNKLYTIKKTPWIKK